MALDMKSRCWRFRCWVAVAVLMFSPLPCVVGRGAATGAEQTSKAAGTNPHVLIRTSKGSITVELFPDRAPKTVENFLRYVDDEFYDDTIFHRVIEGMIVQGGGYTPELEKKPQRPPIEIESDNGLDNTRGTIAMARNQERDTAQSQYYINVADNPTFNRTVLRSGYTVFGRVVDGMKVVDRIARVQTSRRGAFEDIPILPVYVDSIRRVKPPAAAP